MNMNHCRRRRIHTQGTDLKTSDGSIRTLYMDRFSTAKSISDTWHNRQSYKLCHLAELFDHFDY